MAIRPKNKIGFIKCDCCGKENAVKEDAATGTISFGCGDCDSPLYAKKGTDWFNHIMAKVRKITMPIPDDLKNKENPTPAPAKKPASIFG
ncbi:MAG: hypothetical protein ACXWJD_04000 [Burkholderiaceae bacterium]